jgi:leucyl/phenylalanyl-tRNA--protein transferase
MVLFPDELKVSRSLEKRLKRSDYEIRFDSAFREVMHACADTPRPDQTSTWIVPEMINAYCRLHALGHAHSVETWMDGKLVGGLYGVAIGRMYYGESMFHHITDASKIAFVHLVRYLQKHGFGMIDCQMKTPHLQRFGAREIPRAEFTARLNELINMPHYYEVWQ